MGYSICKTYYSNAPDKKKAVKEIVELKYSDIQAIENFLKNSNYYAEPLNKTELLQSFETRRPHVLKLDPFSNGDNSVDPGIKELKIIFSSPMDKSGYSINMGKRGKEYYPVSGVIGFSDDGSAFSLKVDLKSDHEYEFVITNQSFISSEGYPVKPFEVKFKTK
jgi:hypothetical protein